MGVVNFDRQSFLGLLNLYYRWNPALNKNSEKCLKEEWFNLHHNIVNGAIAALVKA